MFCGIVIIIIFGVVVEWLKFFVYLLVVGLVFGFIYFFFGDWVWNGLVIVVGIEIIGGWLENLGFWDFVGLMVVYSVGVWIGLVIIFVVGFC